MCMDANWPIISNYFQTKYWIQLFNQSQVFTKFSILFPRHWSVIGQHMVKLWSEKAKFQFCFSTRFFSNLSKHGQNPVKKDYFSIFVFHDIGQ